MDDMISRQAAIETVKKHYRVDNDLLEVIAYEIEALPSAQLAQDLPNGCTDTISRAAAIEKVKKLCKGCYLSEHCGKCLTKCLVRKAVKILEKVLPAQPGWIPCSERLPDKSEWYLVTAEWDDGFIAATKDRYVVGEGWTDELFGAKCLAWMPLPTPWEGDEK